MKTLEKRKRKLNEVALERKVKDMYKKVALHPKVSYHFEMGRELATRLGYPSEMLDQIPPASTDSFAGVGYYFDFARLQKGEFVLDLGSGSGMDAFYAALEVGKTGEVIGIDMTEEQLKKSSILRDKGNFDQVIFRNSYIEQVPIRTNSIDVVISNGVINLSNQKERVFKEVARVLKSGGRMVLSDIVSSVILPESISCNASLWAACIGGASQVDQYKEMIEMAGLRIVDTKENPYAFISNSAKGATADYGIKSISILAIKK